MDNLAGRNDCDRTIEHELRIARIEVVKLPQRLNSEVPASLTGKLGRFTFKRAWYYWVVDGPMPLTIAQEIYDDPVGMTDVRVAGHCDCPPPEEWVKWFKDGQSEPVQVVPAADEADFDKMIEKGYLTVYDKKRYVFTDDYPALSHLFGYILSYHIDSEVGLRFFADTIRKYEMDKVLLPE